MLTAALLATCLLAPDADSAELRSRIRAWRTQHEAALVQELTELVAIPNIASDTPNIRRNAEHLLRLLEKHGFAPKLLESTGGPPGVYAERKVPGAQRTVGFYAHYDGQPLVAADWKTDPWKPVVKDDRLYGRSASDDKSPIIAMLAALDALAANQRGPSVNLVLFFEGEEEAGSPHLQEIFEKNRDALHTDLWVVMDGPVHPSGRKQVVLGVRGMTGVEITIYGPARALHSGHYGNWAPNPGALMANLIASMRDDNGRILIDGLSRQVRPLTKAERAAVKEIPSVDVELRRELQLGASEANNARIDDRILMPALNVRGIAAGPSSSAANAIATKAWASIDFRLVPDQDPKELQRLFEAHVAKRGYFIVRDEPDAATKLAHPRVARVNWVQAGYRSQRTSLDHPGAKAVIRLVAKASDQPVVVMPTAGASLPQFLFPDVLGSDVVSVPTVNYDNNQHAANENVRLDHLWDAIEIFGVLVAGLGTEWR